MRKIFFLFFGLACLGTTMAQTKPKPKTNGIKSTTPKPSLEETVSWIVGKLNANSITITQKSIFDDGKNAYHTNYSSHFTFDSQKQSLQFTRESESWWTNAPPYFTSNKYLYKITIPLNTIYKVGLKEYYSIIHVNSDTGEGEKNKYLTISTYGKDIDQVSSNDNKSDSKNYLEIGIDFTREPNLLQRFQKAFDNIKSYFPKKQETF